VVSRAGVQVRRPGAERPADLPLVPERIDDAAQTPAVLVASRGFQRGAGADRPPQDGVRVIGHQQRPARRAADRMRAEPPRVRASRCHPERRLADSELGDDVVPLPDTVQDTRTERFRVERDGLASAINPQLWLDACHALSVQSQLQQPAEHSWLGIGHVHYLRPA